MNNNMYYTSQITDACQYERSKVKSSTTKEKETASKISIIKRKKNVDTTSDNTTDEASSIENTDKSNDIAKRSKQLEDSTDVNSDQKNNNSNYEVKKN